MGKRFFQICVYVPILVLVSISANVQASRIGKLDLSRLTSMSDIVVLAKVVNVVSDHAIDKVIIEVKTVLKGTETSDLLNLILQVRGGMKEFDPQLQRNDFGVFFLRKSNGHYRTVHGGSIAIFEKNIFE